MKYALLIGLNYSSTSNRLYGCINDCLLIQSMLVNNYGYHANNIIFMRDDIYLSNNILYPNRTNILNQIKQLISKSNVDDCDSLYIHYSGHGSQIKDTNGDEKDGLDEFIVPIDYFTNGSRIIDDELYSLFIAVNDNIPFFVIFDCCNSGTILDLNYNYGYVSNSLSMTFDGGKSIANKKIICISACTDNQSALDVTVGSSSNGALTLALYSALQSSKWNILLKDLLNNIYTFLKYNKYTTMTPIISSNLPINLNTQLFHNVINAIVTTQPAASTTTTQPASSTTTIQPASSTTTILPGSSTTTTQPAASTTTTQPGSSTTTTQPAASSTTNQPAASSTTNQTKPTSTQPLNPIVNLFSNGITNTPASTNTGSTTNTTSKPTQSNISTIKPLIDHLISTNYITLNDLNSIINNNSK